MGLVCLPWVMTGARPSPQVALNSVPKINNSYEILKNKVNVKVLCEHNINILRTGSCHLFHDLASWCKGCFQSAHSSCANSLHPLGGVQRFSVVGQHVGQWEALHTVMCFDCRVLIRFSYTGSNMRGYFGKRM